MQTIEDLFHILHKCPKYLELRKNQLPELTIPDGRHLQLNLIKCTYPKQLKKIELVLHKVYKIRG